MFNDTNPDEGLGRDIADIRADRRARGTGTNALLKCGDGEYLGSGSNILDGVALSIQPNHVTSTALPAGPKAVLLVSDGREDDPPGFNERRTPP